MIQLEVPPVVVAVNVFAETLPYEKNSVYVPGPTDDWVQFPVGLNGLTEIEGAGVGVAPLGAGVGVDEPPKMTAGVIDPVETPVVVPPMETGPLTA